MIDSNDRHSKAAATPENQQAPESSNPEALNALGCLMLRERRLAQACELFRRAKQLGNIAAAENLRELGWEQLVAGESQGRLCFFPSPLAQEVHPTGATCLVQDAPAALSLKGVPPELIREVAPERHSPEGITASARYLAGVTEFLLPVLAERLDTVNSCSFGVEFWRRALGMGLDRYLALSYDHFLAAEAALSNPRVQAATLNPDCFHLPVDFDDQHWFLVDQHFGQEQLFSLYCEHFHPGRFPAFGANYRSGYRLNPGVTPPTPHQPVVGVLGSWFKESWFNELVSRSGQAVQRIGYQRQFSFDGPVDQAKRAFLSRPVGGGDRFCNFFLSTQAAMLPRVFVEQWQQVFRSLTQQLSLYRRLKYVVSELFIGDAIEPIALAILKQRGVRTIYHEHNYVEHPYLASALPRWARLCDLYLAHGVHASLVPNGINAGSLFDFGDPEGPDRRRSDQILYISSLTFNKPTIFSGYYAFTGNGPYLKTSLAFKRRFLERLPATLRARFRYRGYPRNGYASNWQNCRDDISFLGDLLSEAARDDLSQSCKDAMRGARLVLVPYLATAHLESIHMNIPTLVLLPAARDFLAPQFRDFYDPLITAGICQTDPDQAAVFLQSIVEQPETWWFSETVQLARRLFLNQALGEPRQTVEFLLRLSAGRDQ